MAAVSPSHAQQELHQSETLQQWSYSPPSDRESPRLNFSYPQAHTSRTNFSRPAKQTFADQEPTDLDDDEEEDRSTGAFQYESIARHPPSQAKFEFFKPIPGRSPRPEVTAEAFGDFGPPLREPERYAPSAASANSHQYHHHHNHQQQQQQQQQHPHPSLRRGNSQRVAIAIEEPIGVANGGGTENSSWIHRDKLTLIEIQEYRDRGMEVPTELLKRARLQGRDPSGPGDTRTAGDSKRAKLRTPTPEPEVGPDEGEEEGAGHHNDDHIDNDDDDDNDGRFVPFDPRTPEEIAADPYEDHQYQPGDGRLRATSSRIPLSTSSPLPVPLEHLERSTPLRRKRGSSNNWEDESIAYNKGRARSRSHSAGSHALLDDADYASNSPSASPPRARPANAGPGGAAAATGAANRKVSAAKSTGSARSATASSKARTTMTTSHSNRGSPAGQRPGTRSGPDSRPSTAVNRPEGDPPWLATMYKPDPRLPPDQQVIPTHAKRMMQEKWEREGRSGSAFDREFTPISIHEDGGGPPFAHETSSERTAATGGNPSPASQRAHFDHQQQRDSTASTTATGLKEPGRGPRSLRHYQQQQTPPNLSREPSKSPSATTANASAAAAAAAAAAATATGGAGAEQHGGYRTMPKVQSTPPIGALQSPRMAPAEHSARAPGAEAGKEGPSKTKKDKSCGCCVVM